MTCPDPDQPPAQLSEHFRMALQATASPVAVVLHRQGREVRGLTVTSWFSASADPPTIAVAIGKDRWAHEPLTDPGTMFTLSVLQAGQEAVADHFSSRTDRGAGVTQIRYGDTPDGLPCIYGASAVLSCRQTSQAGGSAHSVFEAAVTRVDWDAEAEPLLWHSQGYAYLERR